MKSIFFSGNNNVIAFAPGSYSNLNNKAVLSKCNIKTYIEDPEQNKVEVPHLSVQSFIKYSLFNPQGVSRQRFEEKFQRTLEEGINENPYTKDLLAQLLEQQLAVLDESGLRLKSESEVEGLVFLVEFQDNWSAQSAPVMKPEELNQH